MDKSSGEDIMKAISETVSEMAISSAYIWFAGSAVGGTGGVAAAHASGDRYR
ncbi:hypothetical protein B9Z19DRAFT_1133076 [Tuber borchii]|uniref:Uncharacterized protein n=1 Tax=Tuber borchii TaxID=42251 RepID=A0A2T6ZGF7_TUBBO|nr:hypothetical protein B9Z19DRAFT_1133076 [Tuber borchii]